MKRPTMSRRDAAIAYRVLARLHEIGYRRSVSPDISEQKAGMAMFVTIGRLGYQIFELDCMGEMLPEEPHARRAS